jgi:hypothetical protein
MVTFSPSQASLYRHAIKVGHNKRELQEVFGITLKEAEEAWFLYGHHFPWEQSSWGVFGSKAEPYWEGDFPIIKDYSTNSLVGDEKEMLNFNLPCTWKIDYSDTVKQVVCTESYMRLRSLSSKELGTLQ